MPLSPAPTPPAISTIYRIVSAADWQRARAAGVFVGTADDARDGFIHFSTAEQVAETAARHYARRDGLLLLRVRADALGEALRWEPSRGGALFPHLYGPLDVSLVHAEDPLPLGEAGKHVFPEPLE